MKPNDKKKTKTSTKNVIITSVTYIVVALLGFWGGDKYKNENFNTNQQNIIINVDGKKFKINSNDYESLLNDYDGLSIEYDNLLYEYNNLSNEYDNLLNEYKHLLETTDSKKESDNSNNAISAINMETFHCYRVDFDRKAIKDKKGNSFNNALIFHHIKLINNKDDRYYNLEYQLDGKYSRVTATLAFCEKNGEGWSNEELYFEIYVDDEWLYTSTLIGEKTSPVEIDIPIPNPEYIEFIVYTKENKNWDFAYDIELIVDKLQFFK